MWGARTVPGGFDSHALPPTIILHTYMKILLTNDDGYNAPGILALYKILIKNNQVTMIAPDREKSAAGHSITLNSPMRADTITLPDNGKGYAVSGTPADCVKLGLHEFYSIPPDLVISGINPGSNTGVNLNYSGTVAAAREAALNRLPAMAVSIVKQEHDPDFSGISEFIAKMVEKSDSFRIPSGTFLNINAPALPLSDIKGIRITRQAGSNLSEKFEKRLDPRNRPYYWYGRLEQGNGETGTDIDALMNNYISITPVQCVNTDYTTINELERRILFQLL